MGFLKKLNSSLKAKNRLLDETVARTKAQTKAYQATSRAIDELSRQTVEDYHEFTQEMKRLINEDRADEIDALIEKYKQRQQERQEKMNQLSK